MMPSTSIEKRTGMMQNHDRLKGFTLIELLVVLVILGLLASLVGPRIMNHLGKSKTKTTVLQIEQLSSALDLLQLDIGRYPTTEEGLVSLIKSPSGVDTWNGPYLKKSQIRKDAWGHDYHYKSPSEHGDYEIYSFGSDNAEGGDGEARDIYSWE